MTGFCFFMGKIDNVLSGKEIFLPMLMQEGVSEKRFAHNTLFVGWGNSPGDICWAANGDHSVLILSGYVTRADVLGEFGTQQSFAETLLHELDRTESHSGIGAIVERFYGSFTVIYANLAEEKILVITDRVASRPVWLKKGHGVLALSSHATALARIDGKPEYDLGALGSLLLYGTQLDPKKSLFANIEGLPEGSIVLLSIEEEARVQRWYRFRHNPQEDLSYGDWVDLASERLHSAAKRILRVSEKPVVFLSGGIDSRLTASALCSAGAKPLLVTLGDSENIEISVARRVATTLGCQHHSLLRDPEWYLTELDKAAFEAGGCFVWVHGHFSRAYSRCQELYNVDSAFIGNGYEAFSKLLCEVNRGIKGIWTEKEFVDQFDSLYPKDYKPANRRLTLSLLAPEARREAELQLTANIVQRYNAVCAVSRDPKIVADFFFRWQTVTCLAPYFSFLDLRSAGPDRTLMLDPQVHELLERLPVSMRDNAGFGARLVRKLWPAAAQVVNVNSLLPLRFPPYMHSLAKQMRPLMGRLRRKFFDDSYKTTGSWPLLPLLYAENPLWHRRFEEILFDEDLFASDVFDRRAIQNCWKAFCDGDISRHNDIERLVEIGILNSMQDGVFVPGG